VGGRRNGMITTVTVVISSEGKDKLRDYHSYCSDSK